MGLRYDKASPYIQGLYRKQDAEEGRAAPRLVRLCLPYPPSVNHYYRHVGNKTLISREGREFRGRVKGVVDAAGFPPLSGPMVCDICVTRPDRRRRDIDNLIKATLDAMQHAAVYADDCEVVDLRIRWFGEEPGAVVVLTRQESPGA